MSFVIEIRWLKSFGDIKTGTVHVCGPYNDRATAEAVARERKSARYEQRVIEVVPSYHARELPKGPKL